MEAGRSKRASGAGRRVVPVMAVGRQQFYASRAEVLGDSLFEAYFPVGKQQVLFGSRFDIAACYHRESTHRKI